MVMVMKFGSSISRYPPSSRPRQVVSRVAFHGLHAAQGEVDVQCSQVRADEERSSQRCKTQEQDLEGVCVLCSNAEGGAVFVVD